MHSQHCEEIKRVLNNMPNHPAESQKPLFSEYVEKKGGQCGVSGTFLHLKLKHHFGRVVQDVPAPKFKETYKWQS